MRDLTSVAPRNPYVLRELQGVLVAPEFSHLESPVTEVISTTLELPAAVTEAPRKEDDPAESPYTHALWQTFHNYEPVDADGVCIGVTRTFDIRSDRQPTVLSMGTYSADVGHNAPETAARAVLAGIGIVSVDSPPNGLSGVLSRVLREHAKYTGRFTGCEDGAGESNFFAGVAKVMAMYDTHLLHGDSQGARMALAVMAHAEPGSVDRAYLNAPTGLVSHRALGLARRMIADTNFAGMRDKKNHAEDDWRLDNLHELDVVSEVREKFSKLTYQSSTTKSERLASLWASLRSLAHGPEHGNPFLKDIHAALVQQPEAQVTICMSEDDLLYRGNAQAAATRFLGEAALLGPAFSERIRVVLLEGKYAWPHAGWGNRPSLWAAVGRHALSLGHEKSAQ